MATTLKIKKGDTVHMLSGKDRGKQGRVVDARPRDGKVIVENLNMMKKHQKPRPIRDANRMGGTQIAPGGIIDIPAAVSVSNVMLVCPTCKLPTRVGYVFKDIKGEHAWFLLVEPQRACLAYLEGGLWSAVRNTRGSFDEPSQWAGLLDRERHRVGGEGASEDVYVHAPRSRETPSTEALGWTFRSLALAPAEGLAPAELEPFAMALCAL